MFYKQQNITKIGFLLAYIFGHLLHLETPYKPDKYQVGTLLAKKKNRRFSQLTKLRRLVLNFDFCSL